MKCLRCGEEIPDDAVFCTNCGAKVDEIKEELKKQEENNTVEEIVEETVEETENSDKVDEIESEVKDEEEPKFKEVKKDEKPKKKKSKAGFIILVIIIILAIAAGLIYYYREDLGLVEEESHRKKKDKEDTNQIENTAVLEDNFIEENTTVNVPEEVDKTLITTDKRDFKNGLAWSRVNGTWVCINKSGNLVFRVPDEYTDVTDFENPDYAIVSNYYNKAIVDKDGKIITTDKDNNAFDKILTTDATAGCVVVEKNVDTYELNETQYGIIGFEGNWILNLSSDNEFLKDFETIGLKNILVNGDEIYFISTAKKIKTKNGRVDRLVAEENGYIYLYTSDKKLIKVKEDGTKEVEVVKNNVKEIGNYSNGLIYMHTSSYDKKKKKTNETHAFFDLSGSSKIKITDKNIKEVTEISENGIFGIVTENNAGTKYLTLLDRDNKKIIEPIQGARELKYIGDGKFFISYENSNFSESYVSNEKGERVYTASEISSYNDGYAIKDNENYVDATGVILTIMDK